MINIETLDYETKLYALICGLWSLGLSEPIFFEKLEDYSLISTNKEQNIGVINFEFVKCVYQNCKNLQSKKNVIELVGSLKGTIYSQYSLELQTLLNNKSNFYPEEIKTTAIKNYMRRFKFFYLNYFNNLHPKYNTQKDLNTLAIWVLFFLLI